MKYFCESCNYETHAKNCFQKHLESKKHDDKVNHATKTSHSHHKPITRVLNKNEHKCCFCGNNYLSNANLARHKKNCGEKNEMINVHNQEIINYENKLNNIIKDNIKLNDEITNLKKLLEKEEKHSASEIETLKKDNAYLKSIINNAGNIIKSSVSTISYVSQNYNDAPILEPIKDYSKVTYDIDSENYEETNHERKTKTDKEIRKDKNRFIDIIIHKHDKNVLDRYLGDIIIKCYKKKDPKKQSLWSSDTSRLT